LKNVGSCGGEICCGEDERGCELSKGVSMIAWKVSRGEK
jgi:hypothetical protein